MASRAGSRNPKYRIGFGRLSNTKVRLLNTWVTGLLQLQAVDPEESDQENEVEMSSEAGLNFTVVIPLPGAGRRPVLWNLSNMTMPELDAFRQFFNRACDLAEPVVRERDKVAQDAFAEGDDSFSRVYRNLPQVVDRERQIFEHRQGVHDRPEGPAGGHGDGGDSSD